MNFLFFYPGTSSVDLFFEFYMIISTNRVYVTLFLFFQIFIGSDIPRLSFDGKSFLYPLEFKVANLPNLANGAREGGGS